MIVAMLSMSWLIFISDIISILFPRSAFILAFVGRHLVGRRSVVIDGFRDGKSLDCRKNVRTTS
jgi:hypothetical protein